MKLVKQKMATESIKLYKRFCIARLRLYKDMKKSPHEMCSVYDKLIDIESRFFKHLNSIECLDSEDGCGAEHDAAIISLLIKRLENA